MKINVFDTELNEVDKGRCRIKKILKWELEFRRAEINKILKNRRSENF